VQVYAVFGNGRAAPAAKIKSRQLVVFLIFFGNNNILFLAEISVYFLGQA
jgi:hypothetical protein